jgi:hypothetical protein
MPCSEKRARKLLASGRACVHKQFPFCIRLKDRKVQDSVLQPMRLSLDPGSKVTGLALSRIEAVVDSSTGEITAPVMHIAFLMDLVHRGQQIKNALTSRASLRRTRRTRNLRYRAPTVSEPWRRQKRLDCSEPHAQGGNDNDMGEVAFPSSHRLPTWHKNWSNSICKSWRPKPKAGTSPVLNTKEELCLDLKLGNFCLRNGAVSACTATRQMCPCRSSTSNLKPRVAAIEFPILD